MLTELNNKLQQIEQECINKLLPENIRKGVTIFGIEGSGELGDYNTIQIVDEHFSGGTTDKTYTYEVPNDGVVEMEWDAYLNSIVVRVGEVIGDTKNPTSYYMWGNLRTEAKKGDIISVYVKGGTTTIYNVYGRLTVREEEVEEEIEQ